MSDFLLDSYDFFLPPALIADRPVPDRHSSKLLVYDEATGSVTHSTFRDIAQFLPQDSTVVFNRSRVFPCRLLGNKQTGGAAEVLVLSLTAQNGAYPCMVRAGGKRKVGDEFVFGDLKAKIANFGGEGIFNVSFNCSHSEFIEQLDKIGKIPIPPYIRGGESDEKDRDAYQTVFAKEQGSVAAPTAGLHFSQELLNSLEQKGHPLATVTLHVGAGTFAPVKSENILEHKMHSEIFSIDQENLTKINSAKKLVAVGTTTLRTLESAWQNGKINSVPGEWRSTDIFLHPGKQVQSIDALVTNFHLPKSSLLMLVSALIGRPTVLELYQIAIKHKYRFFSYGDGMLILRKRNKP